MGGEIVVADPFQRYLGLEIASDAPRPSERDDVPYHLVGDLALSDNSNPGDYAHRAHSVIDDVLGRDRVPIVAGGTGLYLRGAVADLDMRPSPDPGVRAWAETLSVDTASALAELRRRDPRAAERIDGANPRRLARALERSVAGEEALGNDLWSAPDRLPTLLVGVDRPRAVLHALIAIRVRRELDEGLVDELTRALAPPGPRPWPGPGYRHAGGGRGSGWGPAARLPRTGSLCAYPAARPDAGDVDAAPCAGGGARPRG